MRLCICLAVLLARETPCAATAVIHSFLVRLGFETPRAVSGFRFSAATPCGLKRLCCLDALMNTPTGSRKGRFVEYDEECRAIEPVTLMPEPKKSSPLVAWLLLFAALLAVSSAGTVFDILGRCSTGDPTNGKCPDGQYLVPAITLAAWRLQLTTVLLIPAFVIQWRNMSQKDKAQTVHKLRWLLVSGACLAVHFGAWVWSLQNTSLPHSLLMVSSTPILMALLALIMRESVSKPEAVGTLMAFLGSILLAVGSARIKHDNNTVAGDLAALLAAFAFVGYITVGRKLRSWMPIFVYATPVTGMSAILTSCVALMAEDISFIGLTHRGLFGYLTKSSYFGWVLYLAAGPGIIGHTGINTLLRWMSPLVIALCLQLEPLVGSIIGWCAHMVTKQELGPFTWTGGAIVLVGATIVTWGNTLRMQRDSDRKATTVALTEVFGNSTGMFDEEEHGLLAEEGQTPKSAG